MQIEAAMSKNSFFESFVHSYNTHYFLCADGWYWVLRPKAGQNSEQVQVSEAVMMKIVLPTCWVDHPPQTVPCSPS